MEEKEDAGGDIQKNVIHPHRSKVGPSLGLIPLV